MMKPETIFYILPGAVEREFFQLNISCKMCGLMIPACSFCHETCPELYVGENIVICGNSSSSGRKTKWGNITLDNFTDKICHCNVEMILKSIFNLRKPERITNQLL